MKSIKLSLQRLKRYIYIYGGIFVNKLAGGSKYISDAKANSLDIGDSYLPLECFIATIQ